MHIRHLVRKAFEVISPDEGVASIEEQLLENSFLVVLDAGAFLGILTPADIVKSPHKLVGDCLCHKPHVDSEQEIESVLKLLKESRNSVLPVFKVGEFIGVVTQDDIMDYLLEYRNNLEKEVGEQTAELSRVNTLLRTEITERKEAENALRVSAQEWRTTVDAISDAISLRDLEGRIQRCNIAMTKLIGKPFSEIVGYTWEHIHGSSGPIPIKGPSIIAHMQKTKRRETMVLPIHDRWFNVTIDPVLDETGNLAGAVHIITDITERKQAEEELKSSREQLRNLSTYLQSVREEERRYIAREIHDELGQALTALKIDVSWLINKLPEGEKPLIEKAKSIPKLIDTTIQTAQRILAELRPGLLDDLGLVAAIEWQAEEFQKRTGIKCEVTLDQEIILDQDRSISIFRIFQETLTNISRHANATKVKVNLREKAGKLILKVKDSGRGITEKQISDPRSFGLIGIRERVHLFGGEVKISGIRDKGTTIIVSVPLGGETR